jgi:threonine/homoserine/homoserine lactone efflux protein
MDPATNRELSASSLQKERHSAKSKNKKHTCVLIQFVDHSHFNWRRVMTIEHWLAFVAASAVLLAIPGPTVLLVISYALSHGRKTAASTVAGVALGDFTAMTASMLGLGALLAASATLFTALKWIGAAYLIYLGVKLWRARVSEGNVDNAITDAPAERPIRIFLHTYVVTALNPKSIIFFVAFLPQFLNSSQPISTQMVIFELTFLVLATLNAALYGILASLARKSIRKPGVQRAINRTGGTLMIGAGLLAVGWRRAVA